MITTQTIEDLVFANNGVIFGGYVRDTLAGKLVTEINDIDIHFENDSDFLTFVFRLLEIIPKIQVKKSSTYIIERNSFDGPCCQPCQQFKIWSENIPVNHLDILISKKLYQTMPDFDVNMLCFGPRGSYGKSIFIYQPVYSSYLMKTISLEKILSHISQGVFVILKDCWCPLARTRKMISKGWKLLNESSV